MLFEDQSMMRFLDNDISSTFEFAEFGENLQKPKDHPLAKEASEAHQALSHLAAILKSKKPLTLEEQRNAERLTALTLERLS